MFSMCFSEYTNEKSIELLNQIQKQDELREMEIKIQNELRDIYQKFYS